MSSGWFNSFEPSRTVVRAGSKGLNHLELLKKVGESLGALCYHRYDRHNCDVME